MASAKYPKSDLYIVIPTLFLYEDDEEHQTYMPELEEITPEAMDNYIGAQIMIYHGDTVAPGSVRRRKRDVEVYTIGRANSNPILDTQTSEVEFKDGSLSMSTYYANVISESMYAHCDQDRKKHLLI